MNIIQSIPDVLHLEFRNRIELTLSCCRIAEYYESPYSQIKGKAFTLEAFLATYYELKNDVDYLRHWEGFNAPKHAVDSFFNLYGDDLTKREQVIKHAWKSGDYKYLVAVEQNSTQDVIEHELAHARYALDDQYQIAVHKVLFDIPSDIYDLLFYDLIKCGYPDDDKILIDEIHAYLKTSAYEEIVDTFPCTHQKLDSYIERLKAIP